MEILRYSQPDRHQNYNKCWRTDAGGNRTHYVAKIVQSWSMIRATQFTSAKQEPSDNLDRAGQRSIEPQKFQKGSVQCYTAFLDACDSTVTCCALAGPQ